MTDWNAAAAEALAAVRDRRVLVHSITNYVVMNSTANVLLAAGASPVMAHAREEVEEMAALAGAAWGRITAESVKGWLTDHAGDPGGICRHGAHGWHTIAGYIAEPAKGLLHVRRGYGCTGTWKAYAVR